MNGFLSTGWWCYIGIVTAFTLWGVFCYAVGLRHSTQMHRNRREQKLPHFSTVREVDDWFDECN